MKSTRLYQLIKRVSCIAGLGLLSTITNAAAPDQTPLFLAQPVKPLLMLNLSRDHQLYFKLYNDYTDLTDSSGGAGAADGVINQYDTTYNPNYQYYGYFDSDKCYTYTTSSPYYFYPTSWYGKPDATKGCNGDKEWSGNFLNWGSMTRMDAVRKMLYGGLRSTDTTGSSGTPSVTILERAFLPNDTHSFAKFYKPTDAGNELKKVVPDTLADSSGITLCNTTDPATRGTSATSGTFSQNVTEPPLIKAAKGDYSLWANGERWQCTWSGDKNPTNSNNSTASGIAAASNPPAKGTDGTGYGNYIARVQVCKSDMVDTVKNNEKCKQYAIGNLRPTGLLHTYGETDRIRFGLMTGSYGKNKSGGVLRKPIGSFRDEVLDGEGVEANTGQFTAKVTSPGTTDYSIVGTLNRFRIFGYNYFDGLYSVTPGGAWNDAPSKYAYSDNCNWYGKSATFPVPFPNPSGQTNRRAYFDDAESTPICSNWGNPQAEIFLESLRYLANAGPTTAFNESDSAYISGLNAVTSWTNPIDMSSNGNYCAPLNVLQFNAATVSYDADQLGGVINLGMSSLADLDAATNAIATAEGITGNNYFVGEEGTTTSSNANFQLCTLKTITNLSDVKGICAEAPRLEGSYQIAGLAYHAYKDGIKTGIKKVKTYGVALSPPVPSVTVKDASNTPLFTLLPACRNIDSVKIDGPLAANRSLLASNCAIVDFKVISQSATSGKLFVSWEDSEQGGDFDQDMWGTIEYSVSGATLTVTTRVFAVSTGDRMAFGYVLGGTNSDGFHAHSGINLYDKQECTVATCNDITAGAGKPATSRNYTIVGGQAGVLKDPLYYAAKWGGYDRVNETTQPATSTIAASTPANYFYATEPRTLEERLAAQLDNIDKRVGSATTVAANSTSLQGETRVYQARFDSRDWSGQVVSYKFDAAGNIDYTAGVLWDTDNTMNVTNFVTNRKVFTYDGFTTKSLVQLNSTNFGATTALATTDALYHLKRSLFVSPESDYTNAKNRMDWLLGDATNESNASVNGLRVRTETIAGVSRRRLLGDIISSDPGFAGTSSQRYELLPSAVTAFGASTYANYVVGKKTRKSAVFVGANDGMLHAFDSSDGKELFAYIPRGVFNKLEKLTRPSYTHEYTVDGSIYVADYFRSSDSTWRTVVTGTLGAGGRGAFALDVTDVLTGAGTGNPIVLFDISADDPDVKVGVVNTTGTTVTRISGDNFTGLAAGMSIKIAGTSYVISSVTNSSTLVLSTSAGNQTNKSYSSGSALATTFKNDLGYTGSRILVLPTIAEKWVAFISNGTESNLGYSKLLAIDLNNVSTGFVSIDTQAKKGMTIENGLSPAAYLPNANNLLTYAYAGDILGNLWKFDLTDSSMSNWSVYYKSGSTPKPMMNAIDASGSPQPITAPPTLGKNSLRQVSGVDSTMVYFGTGKYSNNTDNSDTQVQSLYAISDPEGSASNYITLTVANRSTELHAKTITTEASGKRTISNDAVTATGPAVNWATKKGWYLDLKLTTGTAKGERIISKPLLLFDRVIINTFIASANACEFGGSGWLMELVGVGDRYTDHDVLKSSERNSELITPIISDLIAIEGGETVAIIGSNLGGDPDKVDTNKTLSTFLGNTTGGTRGRMSWRQIK